MAALLRRLRSFVAHGKNKKPTKEQVAIRFDPEVLAAFRASGPGWQTRMNDVLRAYKEEASRMASKAKA